MKISNVTLEQITTEPDPYQPFLLSQGIRVGDLLFISGQAGYADDGKIVAGGFRLKVSRLFQTSIAPLPKTCLKKPTPSTERLVTPTNDPKYGGRNFR